MIEIAHSHDLPIIVDAAAEEDLQKYAAMGADMVRYHPAHFLCDCPCKEQEDNDHCNTGNCTEDRALDSLTSLFISQCI